VPEPRPDLRPHLQPDLGPDLRIAEARPDDLEALLGLETAVFAHDRLSRRAFRHQIRHGRGVILTARDADGRLLGYVLVRWAKGRRAGRVYSLARAPTAPPGTGRALLEAAIGRIRAEGLTEVRLEVSPENARARRLYERMGFEVTRRIEDYYEDGGPALRMRLSLAEPRP